MGRDLGRKVGSQAWDKAQNFIQGTTVPEPSSGLGLLALGALGAAEALKRKQQQKGLSRTSGGKSGFFVIVGLKQL